MSVHSAEEQQFVADLGHVSDKDHVWMGGSDFVENSWERSDGTPFGYTNWYKGEPNAFRGNEDCLQLWKKRGDKWNDANCVARNKFICKISLF